MAVYVDIEIEWPWQKNWPYGKVSHLYAYNDQQLHRFAINVLGLKREWCSDHTQPNCELVHYDLSPGKRKEALAKGAILDRKGRHKKLSLAGKKAHKTIRAKNAEKKEKRRIERYLENRRKLGLD